MKKSNKILLVVLAILLVASTLTVGGISLWKSRQPVEEVAADVSWYDENGKEFTISTMDELYGLAQLSESYDFKGQTIKLGADIVVNKGDAEDWVKTPPARLWTPITGFAGHFDGQGHTISGIYGDSIITSLGLFTDTQKTCVIKDLKLVNSCFKNNNDMGTGSIIGFGGGKLENIYSDAILSGAGKYFGGLIGRVLTKGENQITNCWFDGAITMKGSDTSEVGGLVGAFTVEDAINVIQHCLSTADIVCMGERAGGICGNVGSGSFLNLNDSMYTGNLTYDTNKYDTIGSVIGQITGGSTAMLKDTYTVDEIANRTIGTNGGYQEGSAIAVAAKHLLGEGGYQWTTLDFDTYWAAQKDETPILTLFADSSVSVAGMERLVDISWYNPTGATFVINSTKQFYGFAYLSRSYDFSGQTIKLGADILVNEGKAEDWQDKPPLYEWTPIAWHGTSLSKRFKGTFDGQGHTISGIYVKGSDSDGYIGLFGEIYNSAVVRNFKIVNSYFEGTMANTVRGCVGSVCGRNRGTIDSVYSDAIIVNSARMTGGIAGMINGTGQNTISNCWFDGKITSINRTGGILGGVYGNKANIEATIENCLNTGDIAVKIGQGDIGGICGIAETWCTLYIKDCLNAGTFKTVGDDKKENTHVGTIFGSVTQTSGVGSKVEITNSFGVSEFYSRLVGWKFGDEGVSQSSVAFVTAEEVKGYGGYQWTTLDFKNDWAVRMTDVPVPVVFATSRPSTSGIVRMVDYSWYKPESDVYTIKNFQQLYAFARLWEVTNLFKDKTIKLGADITVNEGNAADWAKKAPALVWEPARLRGTFDGQGHTISGIYVKGGAEDNYVGLFHRVYQGATVKNLKLVNSYIEGTMDSSKRGAVGSIAGRNNGTIDNVYSDAIVVNSARMTGGIVGMITGTGENKISNTWFDGQVTGITRMGGILGGVYGNKENIKATIEHSLNTGDIAVKIGQGDVGGLCGMVETGGTLNLTDSFNAGTFATIGDDKKANTHIGTLVGSVTKTDDVKSRVVMKHAYGVEEFYDRLVGWAFGDEGVSQSSVNMTTTKEVTGNGGYQWTTLDFNKYWAVRTEDVPALASFVGSKPSLSGVTRMVDYSWYEQNSDVYTISNLQQMFGFAKLCNASNDYFEGKTIKLGADITMNAGNAADWMKTAPANTWMPINIKGTFDGQGHTISGLYSKTTNTYTGLFNTIYSGAVVKNLKLANSYIEGNGKDTRSGVGSIAGRNNGTIDTVYSSAILKNSKQMTGGIVGMVTGTGENKIVNSWFAGEIHAVGSSGGILGGSYAAKASIEHCLNTGTLSIASGNAVGGLCGYAQSTANVTMKDSLNAGTYAKEGSGTAKQIGSIIGAVHANAFLTTDKVYGTEEFSTSKIGWNGSKTVSETATAVRKTEAIQGNGAYQWTALDFEKYWVLRDKNVPALASFEKATLSIDEAKKLVDFSWYDEHGDVYTISTLQQLTGFNTLCNADTDYFKGKTVKLGADITINTGKAADWATKAPKNEWVPINFSGTFDGQGHTISGVYAKTTNTYTGLFNTINSGAVVKNLKLVNSYFEGNGGATRSGVGSVAGRNNGTIDTVYSSAIVKNSKQMTGGIVGMSVEAGENRVTNSWFDGIIYGSTNSVGGIQGGAYKTTATIEHCLNTGTLNITAGTGIGGLFGNVQDASEVVMKDSLNAGKYVKIGDGKVSQMGSIVGPIGNKASFTVSNVYGVKEFSANKHGWFQSGVLTQVSGTAYDVSPEEDYYNRGASGLSFYVGNEPSDDGDTKTCWWIARENDIPMLASFMDIAKTLDK